MAFPYVPIVFPWFFPHHDWWVKPPFLVRSLGSPWARGWLTDNASSEEQGLRGAGRLSGIENVWVPSGKPWETPWEIGRKLRGNIWYTNITMENHRFSWVNPLLMAIFKSYATVYQRVVDIESSNDLEMTLVVFSDLFHKVSTTFCWLYMVRPVSGLVISTI